MATAPQTAMEMPQEAGANPFADPNTMAVYDQLRQTMSPKEFGDEMLAGASQVDPEAMAQFREELSQIDLSPEDLDMLNNMVDEILATPEQYAEVRAKYLEMGAPEELLPEQFDPQFFAAMNMAVDQLIAEPAGVQAFAMGGIAELKPIAKAIAGYGRNGDTMLAHITPAEARMLRRRGGSGTINPATGLPEFFLKKAFKSLGKAVKSFANSTIGKIVLPVALGFFLGPAAAAFAGVGATSVAGVAIAGFVGGAGSTLLAGGNLKSALKAGAIGGLTAGAVAGVSGASLTGTPSGLTPGQALSGQVDKFTNFLTPSASASGIPAPAIDAAGQVKGLVPTEAPVFQSGQNLPQAQVSLVGDSMSPAAGPLPGQPGGAQIGGKPNILALESAAVQPPYSQLEMTGTKVDPFTEYFGKTAPPTNPSYFDQAKDFVNKNISPSGIQEQAAPQARQAAADAVAAAEKTLPASITGEARAAMLKTTYDNALKTAMPGILSTYGPATALGLGAVGLAGGFKAAPAQPSAMRDELMKPVTQRIAEGGNQRNYYIQGLPGVKYDQYGAPIFGQNVPLPTFDTGLGIQSLINPKGFAAGGAVTAGNFDSTAYLNANQDVKEAIARGEFKDAYEHYTRFGQAEGRTAFDKAETAAQAAKDAEEKSAAQAANKKLVADAKAAKKAAGFGDAYKNINAGLSYDVPAGIAATSIAARQAAFKPTMDKFTQSQAANAATLAQPYTPRVVDQPYNNASGYGNIINKPVLPPFNYDTTPVITTPVTPGPLPQPPVVQPPVNTGYTGRAITDQEIKNYLISNPNATDRDLVKVMDQYNVRPDQVARATGMQGIDPSSFQNINFRYADAKSALQNNPNSLARQNQADAVTGKSIQEFFAKNPGMGDEQIANYMDRNMIDPRQMQAAFAGTAGAISAPDVLARYNAAITGPTRKVFATDSLPTPPAAAPVEKKLMNMGGIASLGSGGYPRRTGQINGPGTATSDSIPAMLSDGEFVMTAKAVRGAGKGNRRAGAKRMYALMNQLEKNAARG